MKMRNLGIAFMAIFSTSLAFSQDEDDPFGGHADFGKKLEQIIAAQEAKAKNLLQDIIIPVFKSHVTATNMRFASVGGDTLILLHTREGGVRVHSRQVKP